MVRWCRARPGATPRCMRATVSRSCAHGKAVKEKSMSDPLVIAGHEFGSRLFLGSAGYPNRKMMLDAIAASGSEMVTASIRRISLAGDDESLIGLLAGRVKFLPNTA